MVASLLESFRRWGLGPSFPERKKAFAAFAATLDGEHCYSAHGIANLVAAQTIQATSRYDYADCLNFSKALCRNLYNKAFRGEIESYSRFSNITMDGPAIAGREAPSPIWEFYQYRATDFVNEALALASDWPDRKLAGLFLETLQDIFSGRHQPITETVDGIPERILKNVIGVKDYQHARRADLYRMKTSGMPPGSSVSVSSPAPQHG